MASPFFRTMRSLEIERGPRTWIRLAVILAVLGAWAGWMHAARVSVYATTGKARLEVSRMAHRVAAAEPGRVSALQVSLGRHVEQGEVLVELDASVEERRLEEERTRAAALAPKIEALQRQMAVEEEVRAWQVKLSDASVARARIDLRQRDLSAAHGEELRAISERLHDERLASTADHLEAKSRAADERLKAEGARADLRRLSVAGHHDERQTAARLAELGRALGDLVAEQQEAEAAVATALAQIERRKVRAPIAGKLGNIAALQVGDVLKPGDLVATVVPGDDLHAVALFAPSDAVGRIVPGQRARMRLDGFAWTQFGMIEGEVSHVASEPYDGAIRVELLVRPESAASIPVQHGMPGTTEVEVERVSPWALLLRAVAPGGAR
ncbi:HlyD family secretion protein [Sorangium atrum]|uniref:HlyD family efflux transporter periplasmic adaptor subunit n=1 Tax=Sorangium atrum TaxID=2995308 RepID=A0ABT5CGA6_9BACT|nr:HlyD family efflux transporter periplasmic adaptor subunit [Sorangium aterium]MDC0685456.1 HlyD family efflux transporter periplasmic adaptor subunit [Sorangium aterium]